MGAAIVGAGFAAEVHVKALHSCGISIVAVIDKNVERAKEFAKRWGIPKYGESYELADEADVIHICTPPTIHGEVIRYFLEKGKHILCEKPLCLNRKEAEELESLAKESGKQCGLVFNVRYHMACQKAKEQITTGKFGRVLLVHGQYMQEFSALPAQYDWRYNPDIAGRSRTVTEIGTHWMDLVQFLSGEKVSEVSARFGCFFQKRKLKDGMTYKYDENVEGTLVEVDSEDAAIVHMTFENGALGNVVLSGVSCGRGNHLSFEITCENGNIWWNEEENNVLYSAKKGEGIHKEIFAFGNGFSDTFGSLMEDFYQSVESGKKGEFPSFEDGAQVCRICEAICDSAENKSIWMHV